MQPAADRLKLSQDFTLRLLPDVSLRYLWRRCGLYLQQSAGAFGFAELLQKVLQFPSNSKRMIQPLQFVINNLRYSILLINNGSSMRPGAQKRLQIESYLLTDYHFLQDYEIVDSDASDGSSFLAKIKNTTQMVQFTKIKYDASLMERFQALYSLFKSGVVLADNIFLLEEGEDLYIYIIQAYIQSQIQGSRFTTLQKYLNSKQIDANHQFSLLSQTKILIDCLHQTNQAYAGLNPARILIDQENHLYLSPFELTIQLKQSNFSRAYYPPQILGSVSAENVCLTNELLLKWDVWSFGCICLQILLYCSPSFMSSSIRKQLQLIGEYQFQQLAQFQQPIRNTVKNCLTFDTLKRTISPQEIKNLQSNTAKAMLKPANAPTDLIELIKPSEVYSLKEQKAVYCNNQLRELNVLQAQSLGDSTLTVNILSVANIQFQKQLHFTVLLDRKYHFYIDFKENGCKTYTLNRKITLRSEFSTISKILSTPILIQIQEEQQKSRITVNLQTLVIQYQGKRIWTQPLIGTYESGEADGQFKKCKIKLVCTLKSPQNVTNVTQLEQSKEQKSQKQDHTLKARSTNIIQRIQKHGNYSAEAAARKISPKKVPIINSISQITQGLSNLADHWKRKNQIEEIKIDQARLRLEKLLAIE